MSSKYVEVRGPRRLGREKELHHLRLYGHGTPDEPSWSVKHYSHEDDREPESHQFGDHDELMRHVHAHTHPDGPDHDRGDAILERMAERERGEES